MTRQNTRKQKVLFTAEQKHEYAKLRVVENDSTKKIMGISGAGSSAVARWRKQYREELQGQTPEGTNAFTLDQQRIQELEKQLRRAKRDNEILKKATAFFVRDNNGLS